MSSAFDKAKLFADIFSSNSNLNDSGIPAFPSETNLRLRNIHIISKMFQVMTGFDSSKAFDPDHIPEKL